MKNDMLLFCSFYDPNCTDGYSRGELKIAELHQQGPRNESTVNTFLYDTPDAHVNSHGHTTSLPPSQSTWSRFLPAWIHAIYAVFPQENLRAIYFRYQVYFLLFPFLLSNFQRDLNIEFS